MAEMTGYGGGTGSTGGTGSGGKKKVFYGSPSKAKLESFGIYLPDAKVPNKPETSVPGASNISGATSKTKVITPQPAGGGKCSDERAKFDAARGIMNSAYSNFLELYQKYLEAKAVYDPIFRDFLALDPVFSRNISEWTSNIEALRKKNSLIDAKLEKLGDKPGFSLTTPRVNYASWQRARNSLNATRQKNLDLIREYEKAISSQKALQAEWKAKVDAAKKARDDALAKADGARNEVSAAYLSASSHRFDLVQCHVTNGIPTSGIEPVTNPFALA